MRELTKAERAVAQALKDIKETGRLEEVDMNYVAVRIELALARANPGFDGDMFVALQR